MLKQMHDGILSGHLGRKKTREKLLQRFYWFGCRDDTDNWIAKCEQCGAVKLPPKRAKAPLGKMMMGAAWDRLSTDLMGPLPLTPQNNRYILVITDQFTKWVEVLAVPDQRAVTCANAIFREVITRFGCPIALHSDQGRSFESEVFSDLCRLLEVRKTRTSVANPKANGQTERFNKTLIHMIKSYLRGEQTTWDEHLGCLAAAYRATPNESTHLTPNMLNLGREVRLPAEVLFGSMSNFDGEEVTTYGEYAERLRDKLSRAHMVARKHLGLAAKRQKLRYDVKQVLHQYEPGDLVWYLTAMSQLKITPKLRCPYEGPGLILKRYGDLTYLIQMTAKRGHRKVVHHDKLKAYLGSKRLPWARAALKDV